MLDSGDRELIAAVEREAVSLGGAGAVPDSSFAPLRQEMNEYRGLLERSLEKVAAVHAGGAPGERVCRLLTGIIDRLV
ncbi:MAG: hypothetical protein ACYC9O_03385, partial [Candidatus Latescibacterota bacterium]